MPTAPRILLVDDHSIVRTGVRSLLLQSWPEAVIVEAYDERSVRDAMAASGYELIISDLTFSHANNKSYFVSRMLPLYGSTPVLILSMQPPDIFARKFLEMGVRGYIHKEAPDFQISEGVQQVLEKGIYRKNLPFKLTSAEAVNPFDLLSEREMEVARLVVKGESLKSIGYRLSLQVSTIGTFKSRIMEKLGIESTLELARLYEQFCPE